MMLYFFYKSQTLWIRDTAWIFSFVGGKGGGDEGRGRGIL